MSVTAERSTLAVGAPAQIAFSSVSMRAAPSVALSAPTPGWSWSCAKKKSLVPAISSRCVGCCSSIACTTTPLPFSCAMVAPLYPQWVPPSLYLRRG
jgi:hypothetical protein